MDNISSEQIGVFWPSPNNAIGCFNIIENEQFDRNNDEKWENKIKKKKKPDEISLRMGRPPRRPQNPYKHKLR